MKPVLNCSGVDGVFKWHTAASIYVFIHILCYLHTRIPLPTRAGLLLEHFGIMCLCTVWLENRVEAMEFPGGSQTKETSLIVTVLMKVWSISN